MRKSFISVLLVLVMIFGLTMAAIAANQEQTSDEDNASHYSYYEEYECYHDYTVFNNPPIFIDPITGEKWVGIDRRVCEHGKWGLDILFERVCDYLEAETKWICHGSLTMEEYTQCCYYYEEPSEVEVSFEPFGGFARECSRPGCFGLMVATTSSTPRVRSTSRVCNVHPWCLQIQYTWTENRSYSCNGCGAGGGVTHTPRSQWVCHRV
jgi:hypothetical protein